MAYPNAPQAAPQAGTRSNGLAIASLVCGIVGLLVFSIILGPLAIIFGAIGLNQANRGASHRTMAIWGLALGVVDVVLWIIFLVAASKNGGSVYFNMG